MLYNTEKALRSESKINNFLFYFDSTSIMLSLNTNIAPTVPIMNFIASFIP